MKKEEIDARLRLIREILDQGWSLTIAKKKVLGSERNYYHYFVTRTQEYCDLLNFYNEKIGNPLRYRFVGRKLVGKKISNWTNE